MKQYTEEEIKAKVREIWDADFYYEYSYTATKSPKVEQPKIKIDIGSDEIRITIQAMYDSPSITLGHLMALAEFFETKNINDDDRFSWSGCETCDYGSSYGFTLTVRPEKTPQ